MADEAAAAAAPQEDVGFGVARSILVFMIVQSGVKMFTQPRPGTPGPRKAGAPPPVREKTQLELWAEARLPPQPPPAPRFDAYDEDGRRLPRQRNLWAEGLEFDLHAYTSCSNTTRGGFEPLWKETGLTYDHAPGNARARRFDVTVKNATRCLRRAWENVTVYAHVFLTRNASFDPRDPGSLIETVHCVHALSEFRAPPKAVEGRSLLEDAASNKTVDQGPRKPVLHWKAALDVRVAAVPDAFDRGSIPDQMSRLLTFDAEGNYAPPVHVDEFWLLRKNFAPVNGTVASLPIAASFDVDGLIKWQLKKSMEQQWAAQRQMGLAAEGESDVIREMLLETNPLLLAVTMVVSVLHMVFEFLAFRNNVKFWRNKKTLEGLSARTIAWNAGCQLVVLLYLLDNDTSWMILLSSGMGLLTECWKLTKAVKIHTAGGFRVELEENYAQSPTKEFDDIATSHLLYAIAPLLVGYALYSLVTGRHKGWYSWIVGSAVGFIYAFGFVMMTPQLYINYRLKSVAHLPWRAMVYKSLNTFIDDLFAFVIKMPTMHRLSCLRDDVIFLATLYQRYLYRVDFDRVNEFGQGGKDEDEDGAAPADAPAAAPAAAPAGDAGGLD